MAPNEDRRPRTTNFYARWFDWVERHPVVGPVPAWAMFAGGTFFIGTLRGIPLGVCLLISAGTGLLGYTVALATNRGGRPQRAMLQRGDDHGADPNGEP